MDKLDHHEKLNSEDEEKLSIIRKNLRIARDWARLTQREVAKKIGIKQTTISNWELGRSQPHFLSLLKLCELYRVHPGDILSGHILEPGTGSGQWGSEGHFPSPNLDVDETITGQQADSHHPPTPYQYPIHQPDDEELLSVAQPKVRYQSSGSLPEILNKAISFDDPALMHFEHYQFSSMGKALVKQNIFLTRAIDDNMVGDQITQGTLLICKKLDREQSGNRSPSDNCLVLLSLRGQPAMIRRMQQTADGVVLSGSSPHIVPVFIPYEDRRLRTLPAHLQLKALILYVVIDVF